MTVRAGDATTLQDAVEATFSESGPLVRALPEFEPRDGQRAMALAVAETLEQGGTLLAEAGTGTGKTLAYLVPAVLSRQRVLISTGTKNLQEQIYFKDLPLLREALGVPFTATCMKGRGNFLCLHRFDGYRTSDEARSPAERFYLTRLAEWAAQTETGDRAEVEDLPDDLPFWNEIAATNENCTGTKCPRYQDCYVTRMRQRAAESDIVIVNHHLLCADAAVRQSSYGQVIPDCHVAIVDEAHQLEDVATQYFGISVSNYRLDDLARDGEHLVNTGGVDGLDRAHDIREAINRVKDGARVFFAAVHALPRNVVDRVRVTAAALEPASDAAWRLIGALGELETTLGSVESPSEEVTALRERAATLGREIGFLQRASDADYVYFLELRGRGVFLRAAPIDVSRIVRELLIDRMHATVLTSATLTVSGSFAYLRRRLGIQAAREIRLASEFDYAAQSVLYLPPRMPDPRSFGFGAAAGEVVLEILNRSRGRAFVLFTSYATLREVEAVLVPTLPYPLLVQGSAPRSALLRDFRDTPNAVLLATSSFWQGVDVIGDALSCVIIDKLPFASPGDPITAARIEAIRQSGGEPFDDYQVPVAVLTLLQGIGRLIRHRRDRGVLAILDPRVRTKGYGRRFLESLPPAPVTSDLGVIERFFEEDAGAK